MRYLVLLFLLISTPCMASSIATCQTGTNDGLAIVSYKTSVSTPESPLSTEIINPDILGLIGIARKYWKCSGGAVVEMTAGEKTAVDDANETSSAIAGRALAVTEVDAVSGGGINTRALIELLNKRDNFNTNRIIELQNRVQAMLDSTGGVANMRTDGLAVSTSATATRLKAAAVTEYKDDINAGNQDTP